MQSVITQFHGQGTALVCRTVGLSMGLRLLPRADGQWPPLQVHIRQDLYRFKPCGPGVVSDFTVAVVAPCPYGAVLVQSQDDRWLLLKFLSLKHWPIIDFDYEFMVYNNSSLEAFLTISSQSMFLTTLYRYLLIIS